MKSPAVATTFLFAAALGLTASASVAAQIVERPGLTPLPVISCGPGLLTPEREVRRVPRAGVHKDETGADVYTINGNEAWRRTEVEARRGQKIDIAAIGIVRWAEGGIEKIDVTPDGTRPPYRDGWNYNHFPYPSAGMGSLVVRIGKGIYPAGSSAVIEAEDDGFVEFMVNDDVLSDNSGFFHVKVSVRPEF